MDESDLELLARYSRRHAEDAFAELVRRHLDLVHSAALRQVRVPHLAEEVAQSTFIKLARHAGQLAPDTILTAWLYQVTRRTAIDVVRREASRQLREQIATEMNAMNATAADWTHIEPLLDEAMHALDDTDRTAVLLRYFENKSLREVGATLGTSENAAQKRLARAVERLREFFAKRGVNVGASGLVVVISANAVQAAPVGLAASVATAAVLKGTVLTASTVTLGKGMLNLMAISKLKVTATVAVLLLVGGTTTYVVVEQIRARSASPAVTVAASADDALAWEIIDTMNSQALDGAPPLVFLREHDGSEHNTGTVSSQGKLMGKGVSIRQLLAIAHGVPQSRVRMAGQAPWPALKVDYLVSLRSGQKEALQKAIREKFGMTAQREVRLEDVYVLTARSGEFSGRQPSTQREGSSSGTTSDRQIRSNNATIDWLASTIERMIQRPVFNETALRDRFDIFFSYDGPGNEKPDPELLKQALTEQLGLELKPDRRDVEILLVQNVKVP